MSSFNAKLAVTSPGGAVYPLHIDNPQGVSVGDTRKLTCILYLNPDYQEGDGGELRLLLNSSGSCTKDVDIEKDIFRSLDLTPDGGRMVLFWSDDIPHEVLPTAPDANVTDTELDRYALTVWIPTENYATIHDDGSKWARLRKKAF